MRRRALPETEEGQEEADGVVPLPIPLVSESGASSEQSEADSANVPTVPQLAVALSILGIVLGSPYIFSFFSAGMQAVATTPTKTQNEAQALTSTEDYFSDMVLEAEAVYVWDVTRQKSLYNKNAHTQLPLASLTKLMTALVASETYEEDATVPITLKAIEQEGEHGLADGDEWGVRELVAFTLMTSSNDGAYALAVAAGAKIAPDADRPEAFFIDKMNEKAHEIGLTQTYFTNPTGLDETESQSGSYGSARDMAFLMEYIVRNKPELLEGTVKKESSISDKKGTLHAATNTNQTVNDITNLLGSKTGYTLLAGGNLVVAFDAGLNHPIIISVLGSTQEGRFSDVEELAERAQRAVTGQP